MGIFKSLFFIFVIGCSGLSGCVDNSESGVRSLLVILWDPQDPNYPNPLTPEQLTRRIFSDEYPSYNHFIETESLGRMKLKNAGVLSFKADKPYDHYWNHPAPGKPGGDEFRSGHVEKWTEAIRKANATVNFMAYDRNFNHVLEPDELGVLIVIPSAAPFGTVRKPAGREYPLEYPLIVNGVRIPKIAEVYTGADSNIDADQIPLNFGAPLHELSHLFFKMVDLYDSPFSPGAYSLMADCFGDAQFDPYHKQRAGWLTPRVVTRSGGYLLASIEKSGDVLQINRPSYQGPPEYFLIENRQRGEYDTRLPDTGLAIWNIVDHGDYGESSDWGRKNLKLVRAAAAIGDENALWHAPDSSSVELNWSDGTSSGVILRNISASSDEMTLTIDLPQEQ